jgi:hypothetical protein
VFRLGQDQLDVAQGWVQCSVCGAAFDACPSLLMADGSPRVSEPEPVPEAETVAPSPFPFTRHAPDEVREIEQAVRETTLPSGIVQREDALELPSIILLDPDIPLPDDFGPIPQFKPEPAAAPLVAASDPPIIDDDYDLSPPDSVPLLALDEPRRRRSWLRGLSHLLLLLVLLAQLAYFMRDQLVAQWPQTRPLVEQACVQLGCSVSLPHNLAQLQIVGSDLQTETPARLKLVLTLGNRADQAQAWPLLVLTLTDQRNRPLARRNFAPSEYLDDPQRIAAGIPPRSEQPLSLPLSIRDVAPMGFDLKLAY